MRRYEGDGVLVLHRFSRHMQWKKRTISAPELVCVCEPTACEGTLLHFHFTLPYPTPSLPLLTLYCISPLTHTHTHAHTYTHTHTHTHTLTHAHSFWQELRSWMLAIHLKTEHSSMVLRNVSEIGRVGWGEERGMVVE